MPRALADGLYEHVVTDALARDLAALEVPRQSETESLDPAAGAGPATYLPHQGDRPIAVTWRLEHALPAALYQQYATLAQS